MSRTGRVWLAFGLCLAIVLGAIGWISLMALRLDASEARARRQAALEENVRLALWRMESDLAPLVARESAWPYFAYSAFYPPAHPYGCMLSPVGEREALAPSPLLTEPTAHVLLHFQIGPTGDFQSPEAPAGEDLARAYVNRVPSEEMELATMRLQELRRKISREALLTAVADACEIRLATPVPAQQLENDVQSPQRQAALNRSEAQKRAQTYAQTVQQAQMANTAIQEPPNVNWPDLQEGMLRPVWANDLLLLARRVTLNGQSYVQGCWLDWHEIRQWLGDEVSDLLPNADIRPVDGAAKDERERALASLPIRLEPGELPADPQSALSPIRFSLMVAWACVLIAALAVATLLFGVVSLSERRGAFVSAVTHELRTPLTTFRMYSEMLAQGMVPDDAQRRRYLSTLCTEAERLSHLVENVLAYARLEKQPGPSRTEIIALPDLLERISGRLRARAAQAAMEVTIVAPTDAEPVAVRADPSAVEQILFNIVDNSCKYAATATQRRIDLEAVPNGRSAVIRVRDHGPGLSLHTRKRLFTPFSKSAQEAAGSAPGVGLGLALSRRLARSMGGELELDPHIRDGACFILTLPTA
ncbi:MAG TPA: HAMP domain-containing sensor histidine kinase [Phycisphaerae bacterium]|jgi:signal transduction histidine kinase